ncbi:MAG TPA: sigma-54 dependent transcriptional regulator, partial [Burkholderiales bacterium]|nr:sigma-54 dependent transcriptional regulator [Burkholderiales bacterium]
TRLGASDFLEKPIASERLLLSLSHTLALTRLEAENKELRARSGASDGLLGDSAPMRGLRDQIALAARANAAVLVMGERGTGKELVARAIHQHSNRSARPFVPINCGALTETLLESELFGHTRGSFTGAINDAKGVFQTAHTGTVFLDEVGEMSPGLQVKLLRVLQEGEVRPVGSSRAVRTDVRILAATNVDVERAVADGKFRQDLFYRLGVVIITLPPLRERREDIPLLIERFMKGAVTKAGKQVELTPAAVESLSSYPWPGNVRELENMIERLVVFSRGSRIDVGDLPPTVTPRAPAIERRLFDDLPTLEEIERRYLLHVLEQVGNNRTRAAEVMGIDRRTLYRMAERFGIPLAEQPD